MRWWRRLSLGGVVPPEGFGGTLEADERVLGSAPIAGDGELVASTRGLWVPEPGGHRRIGWHLVSKATWDGHALTVIEAQEVAAERPGDPAPGMADELPSDPARAVAQQAGDPAAEGGPVRPAGAEAAEEAEAAELERTVEAAAPVVIADLPPRRFVLPQPGAVPQLVHARVTRSVLHSERTAGGDLVVRRRVPGLDGVWTQVRRDSG